VVGEEKEEKEGRPATAPFFLPGKKKGEGRGEKRRGGAGFAVSASFHRQFVLINCAPPCLSHGEEGKRGEEKKGGWALLESLCCMLFPLMSPDYRSRGEEKKRKRKEKRGGKRRRGEKDHTGPSPRKRGRDAYSVAQSRLYLTTNPRWSRGCGKGGEGKEKRREEGRREERDPQERSWTLRSLPRLPMLTCGSIEFSYQGKKKKRGEKRGKERKGKKNEK